MSSNSKKGGGFKKPPHHTRWKKGQSGNPKGRPKKDRSMPAISHEHLHEHIINAGLMPVDYMKDGQKKSTTKFYLILNQLATKAAAGDLRAAKLYIQLMLASTAAKSKMTLEWFEKWIEMKNERLRVQNKKGTLIFFNAMSDYYLFKKNIRDGEGVERWPYEPEEPVTTEDWVVFNNAYEALQRRKTDVVDWPLQYPSDGY